MKNLSGKVPKITFFVGLGIVTLLTIAGVLTSVFLKVDPNVIAVVGEKQILKQDLNRAIYGLSFAGTLDNPEEISEDIRAQLIDELIEYEILKNKASELSIALTDEEVLQKAKVTNSNFDKYLGTEKDISLDYARFLLLREKVTDSVVTWSSGKFILVREDLHFYETPTGLSETKRTTLIASDRQAAKELINKIYNEINSGKITFDEGMDTANSDSALGKNAWMPFTMTWSQPFSKEDSISRNYPSLSPNFWDKINNSEIGKISEPITANVLLNEDSPAGKDGAAVEGLQMIVLRKNGNNGEADNYEIWLQAEKTKLGLND